VMRAPVVLICQNNQWAISTPGSMQSAADTIALKALGYGVEPMRVDGNDVLAVYRVAKEAVDRARAGGGPTLIEAITYRLEGHSSSDDPTRYRDEAVTRQWLQRDPIVRFRGYLFARGLLDEERDEAIAAAQKAAIDAAITTAEAAGPPATDTLFTDVYAQLTPQLVEQREEVRREQGGGRNEGAFPL